MKIGIYCPYSIDKPGGVLDHVTHQAEGLRSLGHKIVIITPKPRKFNGTAPKNVVFVGISARVRAQSTNVDISAPLGDDELSRFFVSNKFDVVHFHEPTVPFVGRQLIATCPYPVVATLHAALPETAIGRTLGSIKPYFRSILQHVDVLTRVSEAAGEYLEEEIEAVESYFVPNGIELISYKTNISAVRDTATIVYIGRLEKRKGVKYLVQAFAEVQAKMPSAKLILAGDGPDRRKLEDIVYSLKIRNVEFPGYITDEYRGELLKTATLACYPAIYGESFGIVLLEAMASGAPVVAGRNPGYACVLKGSGAVGLVDVTDTSEFAYRLLAVLRDEPLQKFLSDWGIKEVKQYDYKNIVREYEKVYELAIKKHINKNKAKQ
jgi:phosphatidyl-myo-inositol alpha-mannosyltransferase